MPHPVMVESVTTCTISNHNDWVLGRNQETGSTLRGVLSFSKSFTLAVAGDLCAIVLSDFDLAGLKQHFRH